MQKTLKKIDSSSIVQTAHINVLITMHDAVYIAVQNSSYNLPSSPPDNHSSDVVYWSGWSKSKNENLPSS